MSKNSLQPQDKYVLRLPDGMRDRLKDAAKENGRSLNAEIIHRLERPLEIDAGGGVIFNIPEDLLDRLVEEADRRGAYVDDIVVDTLERAFPYRPTIQEFIEQVRAELIWDGDAREADALAYLEQSERFLSEHPELAKQRVRVPTRPIEPKKRG